MHKFSIFLTLVLLGITTLSCGKYSSGLQQSSSRADETSAIATLRTIAQAEMTYSITSSGHYASFAQLVEAGLLDSRFNHSSPEYHGYVFTLSIDPSDLDPGSYSCSADPAVTSPHGGRHFYINSTSQDVRVNPTQPATKKDELLRP
jgi:hypothetical protein